MVSTNQPPNLCNQTTSTPPKTTMTEEDMAIHPNPALDEIDLGLDNDLPMTNEEDTAILDAIFKPIIPATPHTTALGFVIHIDSPPIPHFSRLFEYKTGLYYITIDEDTTHGYFVSAEELRMTFRFDSAIRSNSGPKSGIPLSYDRIARAINADPAIAPYQLTIYDETTHEWATKGEKSLGSS
ncbi:hypothetical protein P691DRAFT_806320 [Macrolepiota fuliginosa MF-IS2]|uniref:Uncharacterized protein n=1 Tax=Macrolepiota fuliginosa MF-IS2 TaxID=1400762 RepID=A0A9P5WYE8_9AGAR|nr:hypothetical protein P691DRAFT_806320 [Macrolepiota fuliginosa MF-IS2]